MFATQKVRTDFESEGITKPDDCADLFHDLAMLEVNDDVRQVANDVIPEAFHDLDLTAVRFKPHPIHIAAATVHGLDFMLTWDCIDSYILPRTGAACLAFANLQLAKTHLKQELVVASPDKAPLGFEIALVTSDVPALYARALEAGAIAVSEPETKPWGQTVAYLRDKDGYLVELCTALP